MREKMELGVMCLQLRYPNLRYNKKKNQTLPKSMKKKKNKNKNKRRVIRKTPINKNKVSSKKC
jgi:hypothetical protein